MKFSFQTANQIVFGWGEAQTLGDYARKLGAKAFFLCGKNPSRVERCLKSLRDCSIEYQIFAVDREPNSRLTWEAVQAARRFCSDLVIAIGGGSVLDVGKVVAALLANDGELLDYLEVIGRGKQISRPAAPLIAVPTTAGTGTEVTRNAVIASDEYEVKVSMRSPHMLPRLALIDPALTTSLSPQVTISSGLDAATQLVEPFVAKGAGPLTDALCRDGLKYVAQYLRRCVLNGEDKEARTYMSLAALYGGMALGNAGLGAVHGFSGVLGGMYGAAHGLICAALLPHVTRVNIAALQARLPQAEALTKYYELSKILSQNPEADAAAGVFFLEGLCHELNVPRLGSIGVKEDSFEKIITQAKKSSSIKANPIELTDLELREILTRAL